MQKTLFMCPGQGSQKLGMGKDFASRYAVAKNVFDEVDDVLGFRLSTKVMWGDDADILNDTSNAQVAIMATSIAIARSLEYLTGKSISKISNAVTGHSLGEYSALCIAGAISLSDCTKVLRRRGTEMMKAALKNNGTMAAVIGFNNNGLMRSVEELIKKASGNDVLVIANDNSSKQIVISGTKEAIGRAKELSGSFEIKRFIELTVSGAFHSPLMQHAQDSMVESIDSMQINTPAVSLFSTISKQAESDPDVIKSLLIKQITHSVHWREVVLNCFNDNFTRMIEIGFGNVLCGLVPQTVQGVNVNSCGSVEKIEEVAKLLG
ncbi:MAG: ACP S-malonyltransferase [Alphaproteobacteria bacterium]|nr:ACP S-malonyltransferase [Rickettsiales bacterium]